MSKNKPVGSENFEEALKIGRPPNVVKLFPNSKALIVSGKYIQKAPDQTNNFSSNKQNIVCQDILNNNI
jgi:hypothetical protein